MEISRYIGDPYIEFKIPGEVLSLFEEDFIGKSICINLYITLTNIKEGFVSRFEIIKSTQQKLQTYYGVHVPPSSIRIIIDKLIKHRWLYTVQDGSIERVTVMDNLGHKLF